MPSRVLLVEDDETIGRSLTRALESQGYDVTWASDGETARAAMTPPVPDLVLLDVGLPDVDGVDLCRELATAAPTLPILMLTARHEEADIVLSLDAGAVDYVTKPFRLAELLARVRAQLRRPQDSDQERIVVGDLQVEPDARRVWLGSSELTLRPREFDLLALLAIDAGRVVTRERIMDEVWDEHWHGSTKTLDVHISSLRRKLVEAEGEAAQTPVITALPRVGYRLDAPRSDGSSSRSSASSSSRCSCWGFRSRSPSRGCTRAKKSSASNGRPTKRALQ
jgi:DNA-binding response OmpR family regulator